MPSVQATKMEGIMTFAAEWCTTNDVVILRCVLASLFVVVNEWQYKDILDDIAGTLPRHHSDIGSRYSVSPSFEV